MTGDDTPRKIDIHAHIVDRRYVDALIADFALKAEKTAGGQTLLRRDVFRQYPFRRFIQGGNRLIGKNFSPIRKK